MNRYPNITIGASYDITDDSAMAQSQSLKIWDIIWQKISAFDAQSKMKRGKAWGGYSYVQPDFTEGSRSAILANARSLDNTWYFTPKLVDWNQPGNDSSWTPLHTSTGTGIMDQVKWCRPANRTCKVTIGFQTSAEVSHGVNNHSFVWGGGLPAGMSMLTFIKQSVLPTLHHMGVNITTDLDDPPFFVDHHASYMAYMANLKSGALPSTCTLPKQAGCTSCCPLQKHTKLCS